MSYYIDMKTMKEVETVRVSAVMSFADYVAELVALRGLDATQNETFDMVTAAGHGQGCVGSDRVTVRVQA